MADRWLQTEESQRFLQALDPSALGFTFQTFGDRDKLPNLVRVYNGPFDQFADELSDLNHKGAGIYVTISRTDLAGRKCENVQRPRAVFCDFDGVEPPPGSGALPPSMVVQSKNGKHVYWLLNLNHDVDLGQWSLVQEALARKLGADPSCTDPPRVMRLPGSQHRKSDPFGVQLVECHHERRYELDQIVHAYGLVLTPKPKPAPRRVDGENDGPADDFNQRGDWSFLTRHGWLHMRDYGPEGRWSRPGRDPPSISATTDHEDRTGIFYVFSSNAAPFEATTAYSRFQAYAILEHGGDYKAAARDLGAQGFGKDPKQWATERARERDAALMDQTVETGPPDDLAPRRRRQEAPSASPPDDVPFEPTDADAEAAMSPSDNVVDLGQQRRKKEKGKKGKGKGKGKGRRIYADGGSGDGPRDPQDGVLDFRVSAMRILDSDPPSWQLEIDGSKMLRLVTKELDNPKMFRRRFLEVLFRRPAVPTGEGADEIWQAIVNFWMKMAVVVEQPEDASDLGAVRSVLRMTLRQLATGETLDDLGHGKVLAHPSRPGISIVLGTAVAGMLREAFGERVAPKVMGEALRDLMCEPDRVRVERTRQRVWCFSPQLDEPDWTDPDSEPQGEIPFE